MAHGVVIGAGLSGLAAALMLHRCGIPDVVILEKRAKPTRDNQILLGHLGVCRLRQLGVYEAWQAEYGLTGPAPSEGAITRGGGIEHLVRELKASGRLPLDAPEDRVHFKFESSPDDVLRISTQLGLHATTTTANALCLQHVTPEMVAEFQQRALGVENAKISDLELTMVKLCQDKGITIVYSCGDVKLLVSPTKDSVTEVRTSKGLAYSSPCLVVDCEGARRTIARQQLGIREIRSTTSQWYAMFMVEKYYGPVAYTVINARDTDFSSARLRHFLFANFQTRRHSFCSVQLPPQFVGALDDDHDGEMLRHYFIKHLNLLTSLHHLEPPPDNIKTTWRPFEIRETYLEKPWFGDNFIVVGDAARAGSFLSGTGYNLALVCDLNAVEQLALQIARSGGVSREYMAECGAKVERTSKFFHQLNLERYG